MSTTKTIRAAIPDNGNQSWCTMYHDGSLTLSVSGPVTDYGSYEAGPGIASVNLVTGVVTVGEAGRYRVDYSFRLDSTLATAFTVSLNTGAGIFTQFGAVPGNITMAVCFDHLTLTAGQQISAYISYGPSGDFYVLSNSQLSVLKIS